MEALLIYLAGVNLLGLLLMGADKSRARRHRWRIPEKTLFAVALLGGSLGCLLGMLLFRHKTRHRAFVLGIPAILLLQAVLLVCWRLHLLDGLMKSVFH